MAKYLWQIFQHFKNTFFKIGEIVTFLKFWLSLAVFKLGGEAMKRQPLLFYIKQTMLEFIFLIKGRSWDSGKEAFDLNSA